MLPGKEQGRRTPTLGNPRAVHSWSGSWPRGRLPAIQVPLEHLAIQICPSSYGAWGTAHPRPERTPPPRAHESLSVLFPPNFPGCCLNQIRIPPICQAALSGGRPSTASRRKQSWWRPDEHLRALLVLRNGACKRPCVCSQFLGHPCPITTSGS